MSHLAAGHSLEAFSMSLVDFVGRKRGRLFVALSFFPPFFDARLVVCLSILAAPSMGMTDKSKLRKEGCVRLRVGGDFAPRVQLWKKTKDKKIKSDYFSGFMLGHFSFLCRWKQTPLSSAYSNYSGLGKTRAEIIGLLVCLAGLLSSSSIMAGSTEIPH